MPSTVQDVIERWLYSLLSGNAALTAIINTNIFANEVDEDDDSAYPCVLLAFIAGDDLMIQSASRVWAETLYKIVVIGKDMPMSDVDAIYSQVDALIHRGSGTNASGTVHSCVRQQVIQQTETAEGGIKYRSSGGLYKIIAQPT